MALHLAAFAGNAGLDAFAGLSPVADRCLPSTSAGFLLPSAMKIVAAYASGPALVRARINAPSLQRLGYPYIRPLSQNTVEATDPNVMNLTRSPLTLRGSEIVSVEAAASAVTDGAASSAALLWLCDEITPLPPGEPFTMRYSMTTSSVTDGEWSLIGWSPVGTVSFDQSLPPGTYAVIGFEHWAEGALAARLSFLGQTTRPGVLSTGAGSEGFPAQYRPERLFYEGGLGVYGTFDAFAPPSLEVLGTSDSTAHEGYLTLVRVGE